MTLSWVGSPVVAPSNQLLEFTQIHLHRVSDASGQIEDGKSEHRHSRNQRTKMDCWVNSNDRCIYYYGLESLRRNGVAIMVNKSVQNSQYYTLPNYENSGSSHLDIAVNMVGNKD